ncbi:MAG: aminopeptidase [Candidatus Omnitrophica bacterium]|nr:aminopeptidase [Candidatus Omnitrophota bacterium]
MIQESAVRAVFERSLKLKRTESCLIVTDTVKESIGRAFYEFAKGITSKAKILVMEPTKEHASEPPAEIAKAMLEYDVELLITSKSLTHTAARRAATDKGARVGTMPNIIEEIVNRSLDIDYDVLKARSTYIYGLLKASDKVRVVTELGTDITFEVGGSGFFGATGGVFDRPGDYGNLPEGEVSFAPSKADGVFVVDASFSGLGLLDSPLKLKAKDCSVYEITGKRAEEFKERLDRVGPKAYVVAELGIGLNPKAIIMGNILEDEKVIGTVHIAVGNNCSYGRTNNVPLHLDGVITKPTVYLDGKLLMEKGNFVL